MTTMTADPATAGRPPPHIVDPAAVVARSRPRTTITETISQTLIMAWRALKKMRRNPEQFFDVTLQPLLFTAMFAYIFGGAISGNVHSYLPLLIPGIVAQTVLTTCMSTGVQLREDMEKGVFDRFKALPMARIAPLAGPMVADLVRYLIAAGLTFVMGVIIGYRPGGGVLGVLAFSAEMIRQHDLLFGETRPGHRVEWTRAEAWRWARASSCDDRRPAISARRARYTPLCPATGGCA